MKSCCCLLMLVNSCNYNYTMVSTWSTHRCKFDDGVTWLELGVPFGQGLKLFTNYWLLAPLVEFRCVLQQARQKSCPIVRGEQILSSGKQSSAATEYSMGKGAWKLSWRFQLLTELWAVVKNSYGQGEVQLVQTLGWKETTTTRT